jgi:hypothetical protein
MKKIFHNAFGYEHEGWYVCECHDYPYNNKTDKPWFVVDVERNCTTVSKDLEVQALLKERDEVQEVLYKELIEIAKKIQVKFLDEDNNPISEAEVKQVWVDEEDGKKLSEALIAAGWVHEFIAIGP